MNVQILMNGILIIFVWKSVVYCTYYNFCSDLNECNSSYHNCSESEYEICHNTVGSFTCECMPGFEINEEAQSCEGKSKKDKTYQFELASSSILLCLLRY